MSLNVKIEVQQTVMTVVLDGVLDQSAQLPSLNLQGIDAVVFDFEGIQGINSYGIRQWLKFLRFLTKSRIRCIYRNCRPQIVDQINLVQGFCPETTEIESFYAIYCNSNCQKDCEVEVRIEAKQAVREGLPCMTCKECGQDLQPEQGFDQFLDLIDRVD